MSFAAAANQRIQIETSQQHVTRTTIPVTLYAPDGTTEVANWEGNDLLDTTRLGTTAGTYYLKFDAGYADEGSVDVQVWSVPEDVDFGVMSLNGTAKTFTTVAGQNATATFQVTSAGQKIQTETLGQHLRPDSEDQLDPSRWRDRDELVRQHHSVEPDLQHDRHLEDPRRPARSLDWLDQVHR